MSSDQVILTLFSIGFLSLAVVGIAIQIRSGKRTRWAAVLFGLLLLTGAAGVLGSGLSAMEVITLPANLEWPAGFVNGVVADGDGGYIVPLVPVGRVQLYDSHWKFVRGWNVHALGGTFRVQAGRDGTIHVFAIRSGREYVYSYAGQLLSSERDRSGWHDGEGKLVHVPTKPLVWMFSSPFASGALILAGMVGLGRLEKSRGAKR